METYYSPGDGINSGSLNAQKVEEAIEPHLKKKERILYVGCLKNRYPKCEHLIITTKQIVALTGNNLDFWLGYWKLGTITWQRPVKDIASVDRFYGGFGVSIKLGNGESLIFEKMVPSDVEPAIEAFRFAKEKQLAKTQRQPTEQVASVSTHVAPAVSGGPKLAWDQWIARAKADVVVEQPSMVVHPFFGAMAAEPSPAADFPATYDFPASDAGRCVQQALLSIESVLSQYAGYSVKGSSVEELIENITKDTRELFRRLGTKGTAHQAEIAATQYADILGKIEKLVSPEYLKDLIDHPRFWHHAEARIDAVLTALNGANQQILVNIRQANSASDLDFQVALATLSAMAHDPDISELIGEAK